MALLFNIARMKTSTTGTGTLTLTTNVTGFLTFANAGVTNGQTVSYSISDGANSEVGRGVYTSSGTTLTRTVIKSTNSNNPISLSGSSEVEVALTALAEDLQSPTIQKFESSGTWTRPAGLVRARVTVVGGGGGAGGVTGNGTHAIGGGGGGGGGHAVSWINVSALGATESITIGAGGTGGANGSTAATAGGTSSFGAHCSATGGGNGTSRTASASYPAADPGTPGAGSGGNLFNGTGTPATSWSFPTDDPISGSGGSSLLGGGGAGRTASSGTPGAGNSATSRGAGGGGACVRGATSGSAAGGNGQAGLIIVEEYYS